MFTLLSAKESLKALLIVILVSLLLAAINPFSRDYVLSFFIIFAMFGGTAIPLHLYAAQTKALKPEYYTDAGIICGGLFGAGYPIFLNFMEIGSHTPILGILFFGIGGTFLGAICSLLFWWLMVSKNYKATLDAKSANERKRKTRIYCLNIFGLVFGYTVSFIAIDTIDPWLFRENVTDLLMDIYGIFIFCFPLVYLLTHFFITRWLSKGSVTAFLLILFEIAIVLSRSIYVLPLDINFLVAIPAIILSVICLSFLQDMASETLLQRQHTVFKYSQYLVVMVLIGQILITSLLLF